MTIDPENKIRLPRWMIEALVLISVSGVTYTATHFVDTQLWQAHIEDRVATLEKGDQVIIAKQDANTDARNRMETRLIDMEKILDQNNQLLREHMGKK
jgi:hypothetical protein